MFVICNMCVNDVACYWVAELDGEIHFVGVPCVLRAAWLRGCYADLNCV